MIEVQKIESFYEIEDAWKQLHRKNKELSYYQSFEYMQTVWNNIIPYLVILKVRPVFYVFSKNNRVILILPLFKKILKRQYVLFGMKAGVGYLDAIYGNTITDDEFKECFMTLGKTIPGSKIRFDYVRENTSLGKWLIKTGCALREEGCTEIPLPDNYEEYYASLSKHTRQNIRTAYNRLRTDERKIEYKEYKYNEMSDELYYTLQRMYIERQSIKYKKGHLYKYYVRYVDVGTKIQRSDNIDERAFVVYINGEVAAYCDAIYDDDTVMVPRLAIAEDFDRYSPGVILMNESIKVLIEERIKRLDLTHGTESYKVSLGGVVKNCIVAEIVV